jgi:flagellar hook assembly protein FlgD
LVTSLSQNYPNPFNPATEIKFAVAGPGRVVLRIYDIVGRPVRTLLDDTKERGYHAVVWDGRDDSGRPVASGVYFYSIQAPGCEERKKMVLIR